MPDSSSVQPILEAAEKAAADGDIDAAEQLLRRAVRLQEADLGPHHPDLANTLNNLGVVCEKTGRLDEAEGCYRRAYEIAAAAFEPDHPFVVTSRKNLADFCEANGRAIGPPAAAAAAPSASPPPAPLPATVAPTTTEGALPAAKQRGVQIAKASPLMIAVIVLLVLAVVGAIVMRRPSGPEESPSPDRLPAAQGPIESATQPNAADSAGPVAAAPGGPSTAGRPVRLDLAQPIVAEARVCRRFSTADRRVAMRTGRPVGRTRIAVYYTRIKAASATTVEHRWYHGDSLQQRTRLPVAANSAPDTAHTAAWRSAPPAGGASKSYNRRNAAS
jgi:hypothetical protein